MFLHVGGRKTSIRTKLSHGVQEYGSELLNLVAGQLHLSTSELTNLLDCPLDYNEYTLLLSTRGFLKSRV